MLSAENIDAFLQEGEDRRGMSPSSSSSSSSSLSPSLHSRSLSLLATLLFAAANGAAVLMADDDQTKALQQFHRKITATDDFLFTVS